MTELTSPAAYDATAPHVLADPFPAYDTLRAACPVHQGQAHGRPLYTVSRAEDVHAILTAPDLWSNERGPGTPISQGRVGDIQRFDQPEHTARRQFARPEFTPARVRQVADATRRLAHSLVDAIETAGSAELHDDYALPLPIIAFVEMLGVPLADRDRIKAWADALVLGLADPYAGATASTEIQAYVAEKVEERRAAADAAGMPGEEAVGTVVPAGLLSTYALRPYQGQRMPVDELSNMMLQLMVAGHETTTSLLTNAVWRLLEDRSRWEQLIANPEFVDTTVEESLRYDPPVLGLCRTNNEPVELGPHHLAKDTKVMVLYASANRDPDAFSEPETFRLDRDPLELARHYAFGWGIHHCLGAHLARQTGRIGVSVLAERLPGLRLAGETERIAPALLWGRRRLPVVW